MLRSMILLHLLFSNSHPLAQSPGYRDWGELANESTAVVIGTVETETWVSRPPERRAASGGSLADIPSAADYVVARSVSIRVEEVLKQSSKVRRGGRVKIFLPGRLPTEGEPVLLPNKTYLIFLSPLKMDDEKAAMLILQKPGTFTDKGLKFQPRAHYAVVRGINGTLQITPSNRATIRAVKDSIRH